MAMRRGGLRARHPLERLLLLCLVGLRREPLGHSGPQMVAVTTPGCPRSAKLERHTPAMSRTSIHSRRTSCPILDWSLMFSSRLAMYVALIPVPGAR